VSRAVEDGARPFGTFYPLQPSGVIRDYRETGAKEHGVAWRPGAWGTAIAALGLSKECSAAMQPVLGGLGENPAVLRVPLAALANVPAAVANWLRGRAAGAHLHAGAMHDSFTVRDPLAGFPVGGGNLDGADFVFPSRTGVAHTSVMLAGGAMALFILVMVLQETVATTLVPALRARLGGGEGRAGGAGGASAASEPAATSVPVAVGGGATGRAHAE
jgi:hypothetical protein